MNQKAKSSEQNGAYQQMERVLEYLHAHQDEQPSIATLAAVIGVSEGHLQRLFKQWVGLTPKQYLQTLTIEKAKLLLHRSTSLFDVALDSGLSGGARLHDHFITLEAMTPAEYRSAGERLQINYDYIDTPFGQAFLAVTRRGICQLTFEGQNEKDDSLTRLQMAWPQASISKSEQAIVQTAESLARHWPGVAAIKASTDHPLKLQVVGSNFQVQVWRALLKIPSGALLDYSAVAQQIGKPSATRAVATAIAANPVAYFIPCHRVIRKNGHLGGYRWGLARKQLLLTREIQATAHAAN